MKIWRHIIVVMSFGVCAAASFAQSIEFAGKRLELGLVADGKLTDFGSAKVDSAGVVTGSVGSLSLSGSVSGRDWSLACGSGSLSDSWDGRAGLGEVVASEGVSVLVFDAGALPHPGEQSIWNSGVMTLLCVGVGMLIWFRFVSGFRRRSVDF